VAGRAGGRDGDQGGDGAGAGGGGGGFRLPGYGRGSALRGAVAVDRGRWARFIDRGSVGWGAGGVVVTVLQPPVERAGGKGGAGDHGSAGVAGGDGGD